MDKVSNCCGSYMSGYYIDRKLCPDCKEPCEPICADCEGTGVVAVDEDDGDGHTMRGTGSQKCLCQVKEEDDMDDDS